MVNDSILTSVKKMLGIMEQYTHFDDDIIMHINGVFFTLYQLGVGTTPYVVTDDTDLWSDFCSDIETLEIVRPYTFLKVRMAFDPPTASAALEAASSLIREYEYRINTEMDTRPRVSQ